MKKLLIALVVIVFLFAIADGVGALRDAHYRRPFSSGRLIGFSPDQVIATVGPPLAVNQPATWPTDQEFTFFYRDGGGTAWEVVFDKTAHVQRVERGPWKADRGWHAD